MILKMKCDNCKCEISGTSEDTVPYNDNGKIQTVCLECDADIEWVRNPPLTKNQLLYGSFK